MNEPILVAETTEGGIYRRTNEVGGTSYLLSGYEIDILLFDTSICSKTLLIEICKDLGIIEK